jgi:hypothetical protein
MFGKKHSKNARKKMTLVHAGMKASDETKEKMSQCQRGENNSRSKLTEKDIEEIRLLYDTGNYTLCKLGEIYHISFGTVGQIVRRENWKHIA